MSLEDKLIVDDSLESRCSVVNRLRNDIADMYYARGKYEGQSLSEEQIAKRMNRRVSNLRKKGYEIENFSKRSISTLAGKRGLKQGYSTETVVHDDELLHELYDSTVGNKRERLKRTVQLYRQSGLHITQSQASEILKNNACLRFGKFHLDDVSVHYDDWIIYEYLHSKSAIKTAETFRSEFGIDLRSYEVKAILKGYEGKCHCLDREQEIFSWKNRTWSSENITRHLGIFGKEGFVDQVIRECLYNPSCVSVMQSASPQTIIPVIPQPVPEPKKPVFEFHTKRLPAYFSPKVMCESFENSSVGSYLRKLLGFVFPFA